MATDTRPADNAATLVAILVAAHKVGDRDLEREMRARLEGQHRIKLVFLRDRQQQSGVRLA
jgi:hypothetical protein